MSQQLYLDLDGVLADWTGAASRTLGIEPTVAGTWWELSPAQWAAINLQGPQWWAALEWLPTGRDLWEAVEHLDPIIVTAPSASPHSAAGKMMWIKAHLPKRFHRRFAICPCKEALAAPGKVLVDDRRRNVERFEAAGGRAFLWPTPYNGGGSSPGKMVTELVLHELRAKDS